MNTSITTAHSLQKKRFHYIDIAKGILIILLIYAHFWSVQKRLPYQNEYFHYVTSWNNIFTCFYMPAFFIISGFCSNFNKDICSFTTSILKTLFVPLISLSLIDSCLRSVFIANDNTFDAIVDCLYSIGTLWFLQALILAKVICYIANYFIKKKALIMLSSFFLLILGIYLNQYNIGGNFFSYKHALIATFFLAFGNAMKSTPVFYEKSLKFALYVYPLVAVSSIWISVSFNAVIGVSVKAIPILMLDSLIGTFWLLSVCKYIDNNRFLEYWGRNSLVVYGIHFVPLFVFFKFFYELLTPTTPSEFCLFVICMFGCEYIFCYFITLLFKVKPFTYLTGNFK